MSEKIAVAKIDALEGVTEQAIKSYEHIVIEMYKAAQSSALMGILAARITVNVLRKMKLIDLVVENDMVTFIGQLTGMNVQKQQLGLVGDIANLFTFGLAGNTQVLAAIASDLLIPKLSARTDINFEGSKAPLAPIIQEGEKQASAIIGATAKAIPAVIP